MEGPDHAERTAGVMPDLSRPVDCAIGRLMPSISVNHGKEKERTWKT